MWMGKFTAMRFARSCLKFITVFSTLEAVVRVSDRESEGGFPLDFERFA
jgi:hypothetical protein